jgi:hypothetical protein
MNYRKMEKIIHKRHWKSPCHRRRNLYLLWQLVSLLEYSYRLLDMHHKLTLPCSLFRSSIGSGISGKQHVTSTDISTTNFCRWPSPFLFLDVHTTTTANASKPSERRLYFTGVGGEWPTGAAITISLRIRPLLADISAKVWAQCCQKLNYSMAYDHCKDAGLPSRGSLLEKLNDCRLIRIRLINSPAAILLMPSLLVHVFICFV